MEITKKGPGRPQTPIDKKILSMGLTALQWERIQKDAEAQGITGAQVLRRIVDWYYSARDAQAGFQATKEDDREYEKIISNS